jgi:hypothetical protein
LVVDKVEKGLGGIAWGEIDDLFEFQPLEEAKIQLIGFPGAVQINLDIAKVVRGEILPKLNFVCDGWV